MGMNWRFGASVEQSLGIIIVLAEKYVGKPTFRSDKAVILTAVVYFQDG